MGNTLKLDKKDAVYKLNVLATELSQENGVPFRLKEDMSILEGNTYYDNKGFATKSMIGVFEFTSGNGLRSFLQKRVHDEDFARVVLNMYHESTHVQQKNYIFRQEQLDEISKKQLIQEIACAGNYDYYFNDNGNYRVNASEIQAEKEGIHNAYEYLCDEFPYIDTKEHELKGISPEFRGTISHLVMHGVNNRVDAYMELFLRHPLSIRRYYRQFEY